MGEGFDPSASEVGLIAWEWGAVEQTVWNRGEVGQTAEQVGAGLTVEEEGEGLTAAAAGTGSGGVASSSVPACPCSSSVCTSHCSQHPPSQTGASPSHSGSRESLSWLPSLKWSAQR